MSQLLQDTQILAPIFTYLNYIDIEDILVESYEHYQKKTERNRYRLLTANGIVTLSIPLKKGKNNQTPVKDVQIAYDEPWHIQHLHTIRSAYGKSAYFEYYYPELEAIFMSEETHLLNFNQRLLKWTLKCLRLPCNLLNTTKYVEPKLIQGDIIDIRNQKAPENFHFQPYQQVWSDRFSFTANLSILDLLFCMGHEATYILNSTNSLNIKILNEHN